MQNADTTQFFWGDLVYLYYYYIVPRNSIYSYASSPSSSRSSSTLNFPFRVDTFFVVFLCHLDFRLLCEQDFLGGKNDQKQAASLSHCCYTFPQQPQTAIARRGSRPQIRIQGLISSNSLQQPPKSSLGCPSFRTQQLPPSSRGYIAVYRRRCSAICSDVIFLRVHKNPQQTKLTGPWGVLWSFFAG